MQLLVNRGREPRHDAGSEGTDLKLRRRPAERSGGVQCDQQVRYGGLPRLCLHDDPQLDLQRQHLGERQERSQKTGRRLLLSGWKLWWSCPVYQGKAALLGRIRILLAASSVLQSADRLGSDGQHARWKLRPNGC